MRQLSTNIGIALRCKGSPSVLMDSAIRAEKVGFDSAWLVEVIEADVMALAGALSQVTSKIKIATGVVNSNLRLPTLLAMAATTVSRLSNGRFILGVGAGDAPMSYSQPLEANKPASRLGETLQILRLCLSGDTVHFDGRLFRVDGFRLGLLPTARIPIFGAAMGTRMAATVARSADGVLAMMVTLEQIKEIKKTIEQTTRTFKPEDEPSIACHIVTSVSNSREAAEQVAKQSVVQYLGIPVYRNSIVRMGFSRQVQDLEAMMQEGGKKKEEEMWRSVSDEMAESLIVYGTPEECVDRIDDFVKEGVTYPIIYPCDTKAGFPADVNETIRLFAPLIR